MIARILPLADVAEFGKAGAVALTLLITPEEARRIGLVLDGNYGGQTLPECFQILQGALTVVERANGGAEYDIVNTDGRTAVPKAREVAQAEDSTRAESHPLDPFRLLG